MQVSFFIYISGRVDAFVTICKIWRYLCCFIIFLASELYGLPACCMSLLDQKLVMQELDKRSTQTPTPSSLGPHLNPMGI